MKDWFIRVGDAEYGPFTSTQLKAFVQEGRVTPETTIKLGTDGKWSLASKVKGLFPTTAIALTGSQKNVTASVGQRNSREVLTAVNNVTTQQTTKPCKFCGETVQEAAIKCRFCNEYFDDSYNNNLNRVTASVTTQAQPAVQNIIQNVVSPAVMVSHMPQQRWNPLLAAILSFLIPGLGQIYRGQVLAGIIWFVVVCVGLFPFIIPGLALWLACVVAAAVGDTTR